MRLSRHLRVAARLLPSPLFPLDLCCFLSLCSILLCLHQTRAPCKEVIINYQAPPTQIWPVDERWQDICPRYRSLKTEQSATGMLDQLTFMRSKREGGALGPRSALPAAARPSARQSTSSSDGFALCRAAARLPRPRGKAAALACAEAHHTRQGTHDRQGRLAETLQCLYEFSNMPPASCMRVGSFSSTDIMRVEPASIKITLCAPSGGCPPRSALLGAQKPQPEPRAQAAQCGRSRLPLAHSWPPG